MAYNNLGQSGTQMSNQRTTIDGNTAQTQTDVTSLRSDVENLKTTKANLNSPALTGTPTAPTPATEDNDTSIATTAFVKNSINAQDFGDFTGINKITYGTASPSGGNNGDIYIQYM